ncbi:MAG: replicative DNA helicase [Eubacteriales bacterium]
MPELESIRQMPHSLQAEQAILGAIIIDQAGLEKCEQLKSEHFYIDIHAAIFSAIQSLFLKSRSIDFVTLIEEVKAKEGRADFDVAKYIKTICDIAVENTNIEEYSRIIREKATLRELIAASSDIREMAFAEKGEVSEIVDYAEQRVYEISDKRFRTGLTHISETLRENFDHLQFLAAKAGEGQETVMGFKELDRIFVGLDEGGLVLIGGRPGVGKTTFALNIAANVAKSNPKKAVAVFSIEMSKREIVNRFIASEALIDSYTIMRAAFTSDEWGEVARASSALSSTQIYLDDTANVSVMEIRSKVRRIKNLGMIIIDYLQLMRGESHRDNRVLEIADLTRSLKLLSREMKIPVLLCSQLSRPPKGVKEKRPVPSDLRDSGAIEQDADIVMMLYRKDSDSEGGGESPDEQGIIECIIGKNRHGRTGTVMFAWHKQYYKYVQLEDRFNE